METPHPPLPMPRPTVLAGLALLCIASAFPVLADESAAPAAFGGTEPAIDLSGAVTLQNCVGLALGRNFTVRIQHFSVFEAVDSVEVQKAAFEPTFGFTASRQVTQSATNQAAFTVPYTAYDSSTVSVNDTLITGGTISADYNLFRSDINPSYGELNPAYASSVSISVAQPLLQGAGTDYNRAALESARLGVKISNLTFKSTILTMVLNV